MNLYHGLRPFLFSLNAETAHHLTLQGLRATPPHLLQKMFPAPPADPQELWGLRFPNRIGLAAGLDKDGECIDGLAALGFGFIEIGTVTPRPQSGNPKPRLFRLPEHHAIINRMGFNNKGIDHLIRQVQHAQFRGVLGINIGKNKSTPDEQALDDYLHCLHKAYAHASYITINISSPNTPGLRNLQQADVLAVLLKSLYQARDVLKDQQKKYVPLLIKLAPDLDATALTDIAAVLNQQAVDGVIMSNTTLNRELIAQHPLAQESGGLSGQPLKSFADRALATLRGELNNTISIIGVGGIQCGQDAADKRALGASLVQIYTGLIYRGPKLIKECSIAMGTN
ncbi:MAG: quinone-dependent dihydroorotate dehydrogenase [Gammaproteobacteria bacterium]|nr:quinone-dependent dihydroorotate dehydrogenase [Gammaproteobacteria bacterium]